MGSDLSSEAVGDCRVACFWSIGDISVFVRYVAVLIDIIHMFSLFSIEVH